MVYFLVAALNKSFVVGISSPVEQNHSTIETLYIDTERIL